MPLTSLSDSLKGGLETDPWTALQPDAQPRPAPMEPPLPQGGDQSGFLALLMKLLQSLGKGGRGRGFMDEMQPPGSATQYGAQPGRSFMGYPPSDR